MVGKVEKMEMKRIPFIVERKMTNETDKVISETWLLAAHGDSHCTKIELKFVETPNNPLLEDIGTDLDIGDELQVHIGKITKQSELEVDEE